MAAQVHMGLMRRVFSFVLSMVGAAAEGTAPVAATLAAGAPAEVGTSATRCAGSPLIAFGPAHAQEARKASKRETFV